MAPQDLMESDDDELLKQAGVGVPSTEQPDDNSDSTPSSQSAPTSDEEDDQAPAPKNPASNPSDLLVTKGDLEAAQSRKRTLGLIAGLTNAFANMKSAGSIATGRGGNVDYTGSFKPLMDQADNDIRNKETLQGQALKAPELQYMAQAQDPNSDVSKAAAAQHKSLISAAAQYFAKDNPSLAKTMNDAAARMDGMSAYDQSQLMDKTGLSKIASAESLGGLKNNQMMTALLSRQFNQDRNYGLKQDNQTNQIAQQFDNDSLMKQYSGQLGQIQKAKSLLQTQGPITHQTASELSQDLATILANGRAAGLESSNKQEYNSAEGLMAQVQQWATAHPQDALPEAFRQQLSDQFDRLNRGVTSARSVRANTLAQGRNFQNNPNAQNAMQAKVQEYGGGNGGGLPLPGAQADQSPVYDDQDKQALQWAQQNPKDPRAIQILMKLHKKGSM